MSNQITLSKKTSDENLLFEGATSKIESLEKVTPTNFILVGDDELEECPFWVGYYQKGNNDTNNIHKESEGTSSCLKNFSKDGIDISEPFLSVNSKKSPPTYLYMIPISQFLKNKSSSENEKGLLYNIKSFSPESIGIYLTKEFEKSIFDSQYFISITKEILKKKSASKVYFYCDSENYHGVLNLITEIKTNLESSFGPIYIIH